MPKYFECSTLARSCLKKNVRYYSSPALTDEAVGFSFLRPPWLLIHVVKMKSLYDASCPKSLGKHASPAVSVSGLIVTNHSATNQ